MRTDTTWITFAPTYEGGKLTAEAQVGGVTRPALSGHTGAVYNEREG